MKYSMATNWDPKLPEKLEGTSVKTLYGQIWNDPLGGGRMALFIPKIGKKDASDFITASHQRGLNFNYLVNATCLDNAEFTKKGQKDILNHLEWICEAGVDAITVSLPFLLQMAKKYFPHLNVWVSSFARVYNPYLAHYWEDLGADRIILPEPINRNFKILGLIRDSVNCELELIANHSCLYYCPLDLHHRNMVSHASQAGHVCGGFALDTCKLSCQRIKLLKPSELIRSRWIRPEDVSHYEEIGIDSLKIVERFRSTQSLLQILNAYENRQFQGNLAELLNMPHEGAYLTPNLDLINRPDLIDPRKMNAILEVLREPITRRLYIDNAKLEGFIDHYKKNDCLYADCRECGYCEQVAARAVSMDSGWQQEMIARFDRAIEILMAPENGMKNQEKD